MRLYFASDIHGSDTCWRKFLRAADFYDADIAVIGGDITGKFVVPIITEPDGSITATYRGVRRRIENEDDLVQLSKVIGYGGSYSFEITREEYSELELRADLRDELFKRLVLRRVEEWVSLADNQPNGRPCRRLVSCGNDDPLEVDALLDLSQTLEVPEGCAIELDEGIEIIGVGYGNQTPWQCPRDIPEARLAERIEGAVGKSRAPERSIFDFHVPPFGSGIDGAPKLREDLSTQRSPSGDPVIGPAGSTAVRDAILAHQPLLGLHGHIHEAAGVRKVGGTTVVNPGSEYQEGILHGALIETKRGRLQRVQLVSG